MPRVLAVLACLVAFAGCASLSGVQPVKAACAACALLAQSGLCAAPAGLRVPPACPQGQELWVTNYADVVKNGAEPKVECR